MKGFIRRKPPKDQRERLVLRGLVELYLETGKPVGSNTLRENGYDSLSSATIRNYFAKLEEDGLLKQQHSSGGRIPTSLAYQLYADEHLKLSTLDEKEAKPLKKALLKETREVSTYLESAAETLSQASGCAVFLSSPRFDQNCVIDIKIVSIDAHRCLCALITDFGLVHTETVYTEGKLSSFTLKRIEAFFHWKLTGLDKPSLSESEETIATKLYGEVMMRYLVGVSHGAEEIIKTGFSKLLSFSDLNDATALAACLGFFENPQMLNEHLKQCALSGDLSCWIGGDLQGCSLIAIPYRINQMIAGTIAFLGPLRIPYRKLFGILKTAADAISTTLTQSLYKFKISYRVPQPQDALPHDTRGIPFCLLLENKHD